MFYNTAMVHTDSLAIYKNRPARVLRSGDKIVIEVPGGEVLNVRLKDIQLLHPGPFYSFDELMPPEGDIETAWEILHEIASETDPADLEGLADLMFGEYSPATAWGVWVALQERVYFQGDPDGILPRSKEAVAQTLQNRRNQAEAKAVWEGFLGRVRHGNIDPVADSTHLREVEQLAYGRRDGCRVLQALGRAERPEVAHTLLLELGAWNEQVNPYPIRLNLPTTPPEISIPELAVEERIDLTHLPAYAIDDEDNRDPDDAISWDGERLWVHIADAAALVNPDSLLDLEARARAATLYLPEGMVPMLPMKMIETLGLGLQDRSPALSFALQLSEAGQIEGVEVKPSWVQVQRRTYAQIETQLEEEPFKTLVELAERYRSRREAANALFIDLPEVNLSVVNGRVALRPVLRFRSRMLVREAMLLAGEGAAHYALERNIPFPFATQPPLDRERLTVDLPAPGSDPDLANYIAIRRALSRSEVTGIPAAHSGVGLPAYSRVTSPLRRYLDLVAHQQLRAFMRNAPILDDQALLERIGASEAIIRAVNRGERQARRHWTLVYLQQNPNWAGEGVVVEKHGQRARIIIPELAYEFNKNLAENWPLNTRLQLRVTGIKLPDLEAYFEIFSA